MKSRKLIFSVTCFILLWPFFGYTEPFEKARLKMVSEQLEKRDITDPLVLNIMSRIPRHLFVPDELSPQAYADHPLPIGEGQTISQPYIVALMTQALRLKPHERVLEIGTGSGYQAAVLAELTRETYSIEIRPKLAQQAKKRLKNLGYTNIHVKNDDGYFGWPEVAPFNAIIITAAVNHIPPSLIQQLKNGGRLILPLGNPTFFQTLTIVTKQDDGTIEVDHLTSVRFVPMMGRALKR